MIRILIFLLVVFALGLGFAWLADRPGDMVVTLGVGEPGRAARAIVDGLPGPDES